MAKEGTLNADVLKEEMAKNEEQEEERGGGELKGVKRGLKSFLTDLTTPRLLVFKVIYFSLLAGVVVLWPQFTIHQQSLGLTLAHTGICSAVVAGVTIVVPFLSGVLGDKMGNYKVMLIFTTLLTGVSAFLFSVVPSARIPTTTTTTVIATTTITVTATPTTRDTFNSTPANYTSSSPALDQVDPDMLPVTFWSYLSVRVAYGVVQTACYMLFDAAVMAEVQTMGVDYGFQRAWGTLASLGASLLSGYVVQLTGGFNALFYLSAALQVFSAGLMLFLRLDYKQPATSLTSSILRFSANAEVIMFLTAMFAAGTFFGFLETFMYRYLVSLGASTVLVGLTVSVGAPFELVVTLLASRLVPLVGHAPVITSGLFSHAVRLFGFSVLVDPWWVIPMEILESVSNGLLLTAAIMYCTVLFSLESIASFRGIISVVYSGVGHLVGAAIGSWLQETLGERGAFRALAWVALVSSLAYAAAYYALRRCRRRNKETEQSTEQVASEKSPAESVLPDLGRKKEGIDNMAWVAD